jgi:hypothetical protein
MSDSASRQAPSADASPSHPSQSPQRVSAASGKQPSQHGVGQHQALTGQHVQPRSSAPVVPAPKPYFIYDSVTPAAIPGHHEIATYANGHYAVSPSQVAGRGTVLWIDVNGSNPAASVLDVEPGDATPTGAADWALHKLTAQPNAVARIYTMRSEWPSVQAAIGTLPSPMRSHVRWWIADPTGIPHVVPGSNATQWYWGAKYDISTANPGF